MKRMAKIVGVGWAIIGLLIVIMLVRLYIINH